MQLTKQTDISLRVLMHLAVFPDRLSTVREIATDYRVSQNHLVKVVHRLAGLGYIDSVKGRNGGIKLAKPDTEITVGQVIRDMEMTLEVIDCTNCPLTIGCLLKRALNEATTAFVEVLDGYTIADLIVNKNRILAVVRPGLQSAQG